MSSLRMFVFGGRGISDAAARVARSNEELSEKIQEASREHLAVRDRVDISRAEYDSMKAKIALLESRNAELLFALQQIGITREMAANINPNSIHVESTKDINYMQTRYHITFVSDDFRKE